MTVGPPLPSSAEMVDTFTFDHKAADGQRWTTKLHRSRLLLAVQHYVFHILRESHHVGVVNRAVRTTPAEGLVVEHTTMNISPEHRGHGFAKAYWEESLSRYEGVGVHRVRIHADDDGRRYWAREPVRFETSDEPRRMLDVWEAPPSSQMAGVHGRGNDAFRKAAQHTGAGLSDIDTFVQRVVVHPETLPPATLRASVLGTLLLSGSSWHGVVDLQPWP